MVFSQSTRHILKWGWLRLFLSIVQMTLAPIAILLLFTVGLNWVTWLFVAGATSATLTSRLLFRGRSDPRL